MTSADSRLGDAAATVAAGTGSVEELHQAFLAATVYCERAGRPGFRALGSPGAGAVPVYSSAEQLALARGTVDWFAMPGRNLLTELPETYDVLLDMAGPAPLRLSQRALSRRVVSEPRPGAAPQDLFPGDPGDPGGIERLAAPVVDHQLAEPDRYLARLDQLTADVRFGAEHHVDFAGGDPDWASWSAAGAGRSIGTVSADVVAGAANLLGGSRHRRTALESAGLDADDLRRRPRLPRGGEGTAGRATGAWRTNLAGRPRSGDAVRAWAGPEGNPPQHAAAAPAPLGPPAQQTSGAAPHGGSPGAEDRTGRSRPGGDVDTG